MEILNSYLFEEEGTLIKVFKTKEKYYMEFNYQNFDGTVVLRIVPITDSYFICLRDGKTNSNKPTEDSTATG